MPPKLRPAMSHDSRLEQEIERYRECENVHDLPAIYHVWSHGRVRPMFLECGFEDVDDFFLQYLEAACRTATEAAAGTAEFASIGAGNCDLEVRLATGLRDRGLGNFRFHCLELNPHMIERGRADAAAHGLEDHFVFRVLDIDDWVVDRPFAACLANHSLHHIVELESLFDRVRKAIGSEGVFLVNDMIGRNGHMRWPEALEVVEDLWRELPRRFKYNHQLQRFEDEFVNWDCSVEGNEGIRAEDIQPLLLERFDFEVFLAFGNVIDIFVDRSFGHNFDPEVPAEREFIERVARLDEELIDRGVIKPTHLIAALRSGGVEQLRCHRHWTPEFCTRRPEAAGE